MYLKMYNIYKGLYKLYSFILFNNCNFLFDLNNCILFVMAVSFSGDSH